MAALYDITPFTLLDFPGETACIVWCAGCTMRCAYCHNPDIVRSRGGALTGEALLAFLEARRGLLSGVVFSGGEATACAAMPALAARAHALGYRVKLDTNGTGPDVLMGLWEQGALDRVALDYKAPPHRFGAVTGHDRLYAPFRRSLERLIAYAGQGLALDIRTTWHPDLLDEDDLTWIMDDLETLGFRGTYAIQNVVTHGPGTLGAIQAPSRAIDATRLDLARAYQTVFRNFSGEGLPNGRSSRN